MLRHPFNLAVAITFLSLAATVQANESDTWVDVGSNHADAGASTDAPIGIARTQSRVGDVNLGRGLAIGFGPDGLTLSHSIGLQDNGIGLGHNFNLSIGRQGTNIGHSGVVTAGNQSSVLVGGNTVIDRAGPRGDSYAGGTGHTTRAWSQNRVQHFPVRSAWQQPGGYRAGHGHRHFGR